MSLAGQRVVIVGGSSGIGLAAAKLFSSRDAGVAIVGRDAEKLAVALGEIGPPAEGVAADASDRASLEALFAKLAPFDHLVIAASGGKGAGPFAKLEGAELERGFQAKFWTHWNAALLLSLAATAARADVITTYTFSDTTIHDPVTNSSGTVTGSFQLDQTIHDYNASEGYVVGSSTVTVSGDSIAGFNGSYDEFNGFDGKAITLGDRADANFDIVIGDPPQQTGSIDQSSALIYRSLDTSLVSGTLIASTVPEPSTWAMMLIGFAGLGFAGYRRARKARTTVAA